MLVLYVDRHANNFPMHKFMDTFGDGIDTAVATGEKL